MKRNIKLISAGSLLIAGVCVAAVCLQGTGGTVKQQTALPQQEQGIPAAAQDVPETEETEEKKETEPAVYTVRSQDGTVCIFRNGELAVHTSIPVLLLGKTQRQLLEEGVVVTTYMDILLILSELEG